MQVTVDQKLEALTKELHQTQAELADTRREMDEVKQNAPKSRRSGEWQKLRKEINEYVNSLDGKTAGRAWALIDATFFLTKAGTDRFKVCADRASFK
uniref:hypothetical protein n=1 Tax=Lentilactobacillus hilgardii TaxID=1588 RepID=UPI00403F9820